MNLQVSSVQRNEDPSAELLYYLECPTQCFFNMETPFVGMSSLNQRDVVEVLAESFPEFHIVNVVLDGSRIRFFRVPKSVLRSLRAEGVARLTPYVRCGNESANTFALKTGPEDPKIISNEIIRLDEIGSS